MKDDDDQESRASSSNQTDDTSRRSKRDEHATRYGQGGQSASTAASQEATRENHRRAKREEHAAKFVGNKGKSKETVEQTPEEIRENARRSKRDDHAAKYGARGGVRASNNSNNISDDDDNFAMNEESPPQSPGSNKAGKSHNKSSEFDPEEEEDKLARDAPSYEATANLQPGAERITGTRISRAMDSMGDDDSSLPGNTGKDIETAATTETYAEPALLEAELVEQSPSNEYMGGKAIDAVVVSMGDDTSGEDYDKLQKKMRKFKRRVILLSLLGLLIIIGVVVGVVVGTSGKSSSNSDSAPGNVTLADGTVVESPTPSPISTGTDTSRTPQPATIDTTPTAPTGARPTPSPTRPTAAAPVTTGGSPSPTPPTDAAPVATGGGPSSGKLCSLSIEAACASSNSFACSALPQSSGTADLTFTYTIKIDGSQAITLSELTSSVGDDVVNLASQVLGSNVASGATKKVTHDYTLDLSSKGEVAVVVDAGGSTANGSSCWGQRTIYLAIV